MHISKRLFPALALAFPAAPAHAADIVTPVTPETMQIEANGWTFAFSPYFWAAGLSGDVSQFGIPGTVHLSPDFGDILNNLDFAVMAIGEARYDRYSFFGDVIYTKLSIDSGTPRGILADSVDLTSQTFAGLFGAGYSVFQDGNSHLDVVGGVRVWDVRTEVSFGGGVLDGRVFSDGKTWVDAMVGLRARYDFNDNFYLTGWGMIGAGGAKMDWDVAAGLGYQFNETWSAVVGYRALGVDYDRDGFVFDAVQHGPIMGLVVRF